MIHVITEQSWSTPKGNIDGQPMAPRPRIVDAKPSREEAELCANAEAKSITTMIDYWWGRAKRQP
jgi:hypothetical protein